MFFDKKYQNLTSRRSVDRIKTTQVQGLSLWRRLVEWWIQISLRSLMMPRPASEISPSQLWVRPVRATKTCNFITQSLWRCMSILLEFYFLLLPCSVINKYSQSSPTKLVKNIHISKKVQFSNFLLIKLQTVQNTEKLNSNISGEH